MNICLIEDDERLATLYVFHLQRFGHTVFHCENFACAVQVLEHTDICVTDYELAGTNGVDIAIEIRKIRPEMPFIFATARSESRFDERMLAISTKILIKPFAMSELQDAIESI